MTVVEIAITIFLGIVANDIQKNQETISRKSEPLIYEVIGGIKSLQYQIQHTVNKSGENIDVSIKGRHDPMIVPRAVVVVEAMAALTLVDLIFTNMSEIGRAHV